MWAERGSYDIQEAMFCHTKKRFANYSPFRNGQRAFHYRRVTRGILVANPPFIQSIFLILLVPARSAITTTAQVEYTSHGHATHHQAHEPTISSQSALKCVREFFLHEREYFPSSIEDSASKMVDTKSIVIGNQLPAGPVHHVDTPFERITFGMGCFWGCDCLYGGTKGVLRTRVGYGAGTTADPTYKNIGDHTEVIEIDFDPSLVSLSELLDLFWNNHEYGLGTKIKKQYRSIILYHTEEQRQIAEKSLKQEQESRSAEEITTIILKAGHFYPAEDYHQKYRLQSHKELTKELGLNSNLLQTSHVASKLNGYLVGVGGLEQFLEEVDSFGLSPEQREYVKRHLLENEGGNLYC